MSLKYNLLLAVLGVIAALLTYVAASSLGSAVYTIFMVWRDLASKGRGTGALGLLPLLITGAFWAAIAAFAWAAFFAVKKQEGHRK